MAGGPDTLIGRLKQPIPLPEGYNEAKVLQDRLKSKAKRAQAFRALAEVAQQPVWKEVRERSRSVVSNLLDALPETYGQERDQMIGELKAWRAFASAPDDALELVRKMDGEIAELQSMLRPPVRA